MESPAWLTLSQELSPLHLLIYILALRRKPATRSQHRDQAEKVDSMVL